MPNDDYYYHHHQYRHHQNQVSTLYPNSQDRKGVAWLWWLRWKKRKF